MRDKLEVKLARLVQKKVSFNVKNFCGSIKPRTFFKRMLLKHKISSRLMPLLSTCSSASVLDTALDESLTTKSSLTTTTANQSRSLLLDSNARREISLQFSHPKWLN